MILTVVFLCVTAVLPPSTGQEPEALGALSSSRAEQQKLIVDRHNALRKGVKPTASNMMKMEWCPPAAENAQNWANQCTLRHSPPNLRRTNVPCGENLFMSSAPLSWSYVLQSWYNEEKNFKYGTGAKTKGAVVGHYTQMVWHNSYKIGCGLAFCSNTTYSYFYVCQYCPAGNLISSMKTPYKEGEPCGDCPNSCEDGLCTNP
ncbi:cysteine-rich venom protein kaouthin-2 isoform X1 [Corvus cornix cornix]|uniref:cysteine-rich venom protein kaouthin-2 isoform X1 n=1 Tax=Corvus cornix cornix TaxID=932674 RepID=UPI0009015E01|nr:cysteine-rich venom protein kaouthin-2 isoform X1 [Corvus cornix cornix]